MITFGSVCSGIEAASVAWRPLGWKASWLSEIEPFPCALLKTRFPSVVNLGDMTAIPDLLDMGLVEAPDVLCGGTPCQAFSVAGRRLSLDDERGNLSLVFTEIADAIDQQRNEQGKQPAIIFWENVPGVLNTKDNAFGCFLGQLAGADAPLSSGTGRWPCYGYVAGPKRKVAWRVLDAQHFGVPQRRRRVFVIASSRDDFDPAKVLFERGCLQGDYSPSGKAGQRAAAASSSGADVDDLPSAKEVYGNTCYDAPHNFARVDAHSISPTLIARAGTGGGNVPLVLHKEGYTLSSFGQYKEGVGTLKASGGDLGGGSETLVLGEAPSFLDTPYRISSDASNCMRSGNPHSGVKEAAISPTLDTTIPSPSKAQGGLCIVREKPAVAYGVAENQRSECRLTETMASLTTPGGKPGQGNPVVLAPNGDTAIKFYNHHPQGGQVKEAEVCQTLAAKIDNQSDLPLVQDGDLAVRRLTPVECERLQGFPDNWTRISWRGKDEDKCPDAPRYKAIGNSWAVPVVRWLGKRIMKELGD